MKTVVWCTRVRQLMDHWNHTRKAIWSSSSASQPPPQQKQTARNYSHQTGWFQHPPPKSYQLSSYPNPPSKTPKPPGNVPTPQRRRWPWLERSLHAFFFSVRAVLEKLAHPLRCSHGPHLGGMGIKKPMVSTESHQFMCFFTGQKVLQGKSNHNFHGIFLGTKISF